jgi:2-keto-4-pentenoate hydratase/2-oxohepta-3-ene-1,7-dioic acid hydratase in catechol pathway
MDNAVRVCLFSKASWPRPQVGLLLNSSVVDLAGAWRLAFDPTHEAPHSVMSVIERKDELYDGLRNIVAHFDSANARLTRLEQNLVHAKGDIRLECPLTPTSLRDVPAFRSHVVAGLDLIGFKGLQTREISSLPAYYRGDPTTVIGPADDVVAPSYSDDTMDFEAEIAIVVSRTARDLSEEDARKAIGGYLIFNDVSIRSRQMEEMKTLIGPGKGKDFHTGNVLGPAVLIDPMLDPNSLTFEVRVDGQTWAGGPVGKMEWSMEYIVSHLSAGQYVRSGDVIGTGTFPKGCGLELGRYPKFGSLVEIEVPPLGCIANHFRAPLGS